MRNAVRPLLARISHKGRHPDGTGAGDGQEHRRIMSINCSYPVVIPTAQGRRRCGDEPPVVVLPAFRFVNRKLMPTAALTEYLRNDVSLFNASQLLIQALKRKDEAFVVDAELVEDRGV